ncbi:OsmC family protein [Pseudoalteromonas prydzensis]|uniref:OsmC family protein n=1 Tax=Pseudoalteromonas prydzensis TaxID=182141 RepID=UPI0024BCB340|nr:OsmC family protein [Pseudoalteromonas prydzensis]
MTIKKSALSHWSGNIKSGKGHINTESGALTNQPFGFNTRFDGKQGTNPEELIAAAHSACFSMALSLALTEADYVADDITTSAVVSLDEVDDGFAVSHIALHVEAKIASISESEFNKLCEQTKQGCPISKLMNAEISLSTALN